MLSTTCCVEHIEGTFGEIIDLQGHLIPGSWNTVEVTSSTIDNIKYTTYVDVYRQIHGDE